MFAPHRTNTREKMSKYIQTKDSDGSEFGNADYARRDTLTRLCAERFHRQEMEIWDPSAGSNRYSTRTEWTYSD